MSRPPYHKDSQSCAKCGHWDRQTVRYQSLVIKMDGKPVDEYLERQCAACHYTWEEACIDAIH